MKPLEEGDYDGLVERMGYLCGVKRRQQATDEMFEPLKQTIELLQTYQQEMKDRLPTTPSITHYSMQRVQRGAVMVVIVWCVQSVPITTNVASLKPTQRR
jgi:hypothetical protein